MGLFKDVRTLHKQAKDMTPPEHRGMLGGVRALKDTAAFGVSAMGDMQAEAHKAQHLMANGRQGTATITAVRQTGMLVNDNPQIEMDLQISLDGTSPYAATHRQVVALIAIPGFQPGATVPVRVDPQDLQSLIVA
jgi:hypothetical protein